jgi:hypothetical protein
VLKSVSEITCPLDLEEGEYLRPSARRGNAGALPPRAAQNRK